jgi:hypothetical protein
MKYATIIATWHQLPLGRRHVTYKWEGDANLPVIIDRQTLRFELNQSVDEFPKEINFLPWPLKLIDDDDEAYWCYDGALYSRTDGLNKLLWLYYWWRTRARRYWHPFKYRLLLTLMVWGAAYIPEFERPSWRHIGRKRV